ALSVNQGDLVSFDLTSGAFVAVHAIEHLFTSLQGFSKVIGWPEGLAFGGFSGFLSLKTPFIEPTKPDLEIAFVGPSRATNVANSALVLRFSVVNHGPGPVPATIVRMPNEVRSLGTLREGETRLFESEYVATPGLVEGIATVSSALEDPDPANNDARFATELMSGLVLREGFELPIKATALIS